MKYFYDADAHGARKVIVSVKSGKLKAPAAGAGAADGGMVKDTASAGFYTSATGRKYPRVQLLTIEGLMTGT